MYAKLILKKGKERSVLKYHPWIYADSVAHIDNYKHDGQMCFVYSSERKKIASGFCNKKTSIICRVISFDSENIDRSLLKKRIYDAYALRKQTVCRYANGYRLLNAEGDLLPGVIADVYNDIVCVQFQNAGVERFKQHIIDIIVELMKPQAVIERSDQPHRKKEGLQLITDIVYGTTDGIAEINEHGCRFHVDVINGQKTGFFLDQRENRRILGSVASGVSVCNCFCYTGGFSVYAHAAGASRVVSVDIAEPAVEYARKNIELNGFTESNVIKANVFEYLANEKQMFDIVVLDPPRFASSKKELKKALKAYKNINKKALNRIKPGGMLFTFSCSRAVDTASFFKAIHDTAQSIGKHVQILQKLSADVDHPKSLYHKEADYLKGLLLRVIS